MQPNQILFENKYIDFIRIAKTEMWLLKACGGRILQKGGLRRARAIEQTRGKVQQRPCKG